MNNFSKQCSIYIAITFTYWEDRGVIEGFILARVE